MSAQVTTKIRLSRSPNYVEPGLSGGGELHSLGAADEQGHAECSLEGPDLLGDGRGGEVERDGGVGHGPVPDDGLEGPELA